MPSTNIGTLGKYDQRRLWKKICIVYPFYLSFKKFTKFQPIIEVKQLKVGRKYHDEINAFTILCWPQLLAPNYCNVLFPGFSPIMPEEFGEHLTRDQRPFSSYRISPDPSDSQLHDGASSLQFTHSFSVGFRSEDRDSNGKRFILRSVAHFCVYFDVCFGLLSCWKIKTWPIIRFLTEAVRFLFFYLLVFDRIHDAMHLNKMSRTSSRKTGPQH